MASFFSKKVGFSLKTSCLCFFSHLKPAFAARIGTLFSKSCGRLFCQ